MFETTSTTVGQLHVNRLKPNVKVSILGDSTQPGYTIRMHMTVLTNRRGHEGPQVITVAKTHESARSKLERPEREYWRLFALFSMEYIIQISGMEYNSSRLKRKEARGSKMEYIYKLNCKEFDREFGLAQEKELMRFLQIICQNPHFLLCQTNRMQLYRRPSKICWTDLRQKTNYDCFLGLEMNTFASVCLR